TGPSRRAITARAGLPVHSVTRAYTAVGTTQRAGPMSSRGSAPRKNTSSATPATSATASTPHRPSAAAATGPATHGAVAGIPARTSPPASEAAARPTPAAATATFGARPGARPARFEGARRMISSPPTVQVRALPRAQPATVRGPPPSAPSDAARSGAATTTARPATHPAPGRDAGGSGLMRLAYEAARRAGARRVLLEGAGSYRPEARLAAREHGHGGRSCAFSSSEPGGMWGAG